MLAKIVLPTREECRNYAAENYDWTNIAQRVRQVIVFQK
jgi:hypothetical protein